MKKRLLQFGSFLMALVVLFVSIGWDVKYHYCTTEHRLSGNFGESAESCLHCIGHEHEHEANFAQPHEIQFDAKCCCEDFESKIQFAGNYVFSIEKHLNVQFQPNVLVNLGFHDLMPKAKLALQHFTVRKIPPFQSSRDRLVFFSSLRLNPLVF